MADIVDIALGAANFKTLVKALSAAKLVDALKQPGPFTVFAPTDEAFSKLPAGTIDALLKDISKLTAVLTYHVVSGKITSQDVLKLTAGGKTAEAKTLQGQTVKLSVRNGEVYVNDARVIKADIFATNGVIHVIDKVILPQ
ncbi:fasciclin [Candidatus Marsarchaeota G2 archaeon ECH_B_SAG-G16]|jgi:Secreted and surface protein containing fasciclin-like repeats|uniref:Fasciclin n=3 Tax=Candidatus Marsarchaeota TaxID=1978152 RepID=A0A2R6A8U1_9ARCH|nr:MAG: fasciclin [Candidatus Marsarchaeota G1 archaeon OSP_D]PSN88010.1 MAG: fasciclin [Candidatus Marsarchaeota G1 archaeon OSP_C]PSO05724.1 MAG: fasciclin [Candidatus Marsarchaeota G2 archaeon ECH_B_SAG-G16]